MTRRPEGESRVRKALDAALRVEAAPRDPGALANVLTFAWRTLLKIRHTPEQLFDVVVTPVMFTVIFTYLFGGALAGSPEAYLQFLLPGILVQSVMFTTIYTGFTLNSDIHKGVFDRFRSMPVWRPAPVVGALVGDTVRYSISSLIVVVIGVIMGFRPETGVAGVLVSVLLLVLFAVGIGWIFTVIALLVRTPSTVMTLGWLALMPLTFISNVYVEPATMPDWLQVLVGINPVSAVVSAIRGVMDGTVTPARIGAALLAPALITLVCAPVAMRLYGRER